MDLNLIGYLFSFAFGAAVGSFLNVVIYRVPLGLSVVSPPSHCPSCDSKIAPLRNIPIVSYLLLKGRCGDCGAGISARYPLVEALTALFFTALWWRFGPGAELVFYCLFAAGVVAMIFIDIDHKIIPDSISLGGIVVGFASSFFTPLGWTASLIGMALGAGSLLSVAVAYWLVTKREGMGMGDVKLLGAIGAFLGWEAVLFTIFMASVSGALLGGVLLLLSGGDRHLEIPFGPYLAFGAVLYLFAGEAIVDWYIGGGAYQLLM